MRESERETERQKETERQRDRETERQRDRETERVCVSNATPHQQTVQEYIHVPCKDSELGPEPELYT